MTAIYYLITLGLAVWRLASMVSEERIFQWFRTLLGVVHNDDGEVVGYTRGFLSEGVTCLWCTSIWITPILWWSQTRIPWLIYMLAASAIAIGFSIVLGYIKESRQTQHQHDDLGSAIGIRKYRPYG